MICDWENRPRQRLDFVFGKRAVTRFEVLQRLPNNSTRVKLTPITGRSHQLRLHMLALGHPILGDKFYAHPQAKSMASRLCLHAEQLTITHPITAEPMIFRAEANFQSKNAIWRCWYTSVATRKRTLKIAPHWNALQCGAIWSRGFPFAAKPIHHLHLSTVLIIFTYHLYLSMGADFLSLHSPPYGVKLLPIF